MSDDSDYALLDENQATRLVIIREVTQMITTKSAMAGTTLAYGASELMCLCEYVENGMAVVQHKLLGDAEPEKDEDSDA